MLNTITVIYNRCVHIRDSHINFKGLDFALSTAYHCFWYLVTLYLCQNIPVRKYCFGKTKLKMAFQ